MALIIPGPFPKNMPIGKYCFLKLSEELPKDSKKEFKSATPNEPSKFYCIHISVRIRKPHLALLQKQHVPKTCCKLTNSDPENPKPVNNTMCQMEAKMPSQNPAVTVANFAYLQAEVST